MSAQLSELIELAKSRGFLVAVKPRLKVCVFHGYVRKPFDESVKYLTALLKV